MTETRFPIPTPHELLARWDAQQTAYIKHRDQRFAVMIDTILRRRGAAPRVLDLACGPGSLTAAIIAGLPDAQVTAVDKDPVLLAIASDVFADRSSVVVRAADLDEVSWLGELVGPFDAVVSSTALHWLRPEVLARLYLQLADLVAPNGLFLNADHLLYDPIATPALVELARQDDRYNQDTAFAAGTDSWDEWWTAAQSLPQYTAAARARAALWSNKVPPPKVTLGYHLETLRSAGFSQVGTIWQYLDDYVICAMR